MHTLGADIYSSRYKYRNYESTAYVADNEEIALLVG